MFRKHALVFKLVPYFCKVALVFSSIWFTVPTWATTISIDSLVSGGAGSRQKPLNGELIFKSLKPGDTIIFDQAKEYFFFGPIAIPDHVTFDGTNGASKIIITGSSASTAFIIINGDSISFLNLDFFVEISTLPTLFFINNSKNIHFSNNTFSARKDSKVGFIRMRDSKNINIENSLFSNGYEASHVYGNSSNIRISKNTIKGTSQYGIRIQGDAKSASKNIEIFDNNISGMFRPMPVGAGHGIYVHIGENVSNLRHENISVENNVIKGVDFGFTNGGNGDLIEYCDVDHGSVSSNKVSDGGDVGIAIIRSNNISINKNITSLNNTNGIVLWETNDSIVSDNVVFNNNQDRLKQWNDKAFKGGIRVMARVGLSVRNVLTNNSSYDDQKIPTQDYGIYLMKSSFNTTVSGNFMHGNKFGNILNEAEKSK